METLILNKKLREKYANELYKTIEEDFSWDVTAKKIIDDITKE
jgi:glycosyltransferase involved in cell wall biosynthesis